MHRGGNVSVNVNSTLFFRSLHQEWANQTSSFRPHRPLLYYRAISDFNVSLLESSTFHARNARDQLFDYYRADILAKAIAYYLDDYALFKMRLPVMVCQYLQFEPLLRLMDDIAVYVQQPKGTWSLQKEVEIESEFGRRTGAVFGGVHSIYNAAVSEEHRGKKTLFTVDDTNRSEAVKWHRDHWTLGTNDDTKIPHFYAMMDFDDVHSERVFGVRLSGIRGMATLLHVIAMVDAKAWPLGERCFDLQRHDGNVRDTAHSEMVALSDVVTAYFRNVLPFILGNATESERVHLEEWVIKWTGGETDGAKLMIKWLDQDKRLFANIRSWQLYQRDVPRNLYWNRRRHFDRIHRGEQWEI